MRPRTLDDFASDWRPSGAQMCFRVCPECGSQNYKVYVSTETGAWICFRCDARGRVDLGGGATQLRERMVARYKSWRRTWPAVEMPETRSLSSHACGYLVARRMRALGSLYQMSEGADQRHAQRIIIPYVNREGTTIYYSARSYIGAEPKYLNMGGPHPLYVPGWVSGATSSATFDDLVLVEGVFDAMKVHSCTGLDVAAIGGRSLARYLLHDLMDMRPRRVRVALDGDNPGILGSLHLTRLLLPFVDQVEIVRLPAGEDPGSMTAEQLREVFKIGSVD